jgi:hypothetical protein
MHGHLNGAATVILVFVLLFVVLACVDVTRSPKGD